MENKYMTMILVRTQDRAAVVRTCDAKTKALFQKLCEMQPKAFKLINSGTEFAILEIQKDYYGFQVLVKGKKTRKAEGHKKFLN